MTLGEIQTAISVEYDFTTATEPVTSEEYKRRTKIINRFEKKWKRAKNSNWVELYETTTLPTTVGVSTISLPSDFTFRGMAIKKSGFITVGTIPYPFLLPNEVQNLSAQDQAVWLTGNPQAGYKLNIQPTPTEVVDIVLNYYTNNLATDSTGTGKEVMTDQTDITKVPDPEYLILSALGVLFKTDESPSLGMDYERQAVDVLRDMIADSEAVLGQDQIITTYQDAGGFPAIGDK
jgi:hypothetical protein